MIFGFGLRQRSHRVASDNSMTMTTYVGKCNDLVQSCWAKMPNELLREILIKVETSESTWPSRRNAVACAGVCKNWREIVRDVVKRPELSGKITFPISLKQPGPRGSPIHCLIRRNRSAQTFHLYLNSTLALEDEGKFLLAAYKVRRPTSSHYFIAIHPHDCSKGYIGKLRSNFLATKFIVNDALPPHAGTKLMKSRSSKIFGSKQVSAMVKSGSYRVAQVSYELNSLGSRGPRKMQCIMDAIPASAVATGGVAPTQTEFPLCKYNSFPLLPFLRSNSVRNHPTQEQHVALAMWNKSPRWHEQLQCWCLNFHGRVTIASVKNFQLVAAPRDDIAATGPENVILQFGKVGKDVFTMDYSYPLSAFQAFAICLSSFDTKIACN